MFYTSILMQHLIFSLKITFNIQLKLSQSVSLLHPVLLLLIKGLFKNVTCGIKKGYPYHFMSELLPPQNERIFKSYPIHLYASPRFVCIILDLHLSCSISNILENDITTEMDFKHIVFISMWVWDNLIKSMKWDLDPLSHFCNQFPFASQMQLFGWSLNQCNML